MMHRSAKALLVTSAMLFAAGASNAGEANLIVGDTVAGHTYVYGLPELKLKADFAGLGIGGHAGIIAMPDGRVLVPDEVNKQLAILQLGKGAPAIAARIPMPIPLGDRYGWTAIDPKGDFFLATSDDDDETVELLSIVDLRTYAVKQIKVDTKGTPDAEFGITVGGEPAMAYFHLADRIDVYPLATLAAAETKLDAIVSGALKPVATLLVGPGGHSDSVSVAAGLWMGSTLRGLEMGRIAGSGLSDHRTIPWDVDGRAGGRNARQRLTADGLHEFGPLNAQMPAEKWAETQNDLHWVDLTSGAAHRMPLAAGLVGRAGVSARYALYAAIGAAGDTAVLVGTDPKAADFRQIAPRIPLPPLRSGPVAGKDPAGSESRYPAIAVDGRLAFVSQGGEGAILVIDTTRKEFIDTILTPTPLKRGGYLAAVELGAPLSELSGR